MKTPVTFPLWTLEDKISFVKEETEKEIGLKKIREIEESEKQGLKISKETFLNSKLVNPNNPTYYEPSTQPLFHQIKALNRKLSQH